MDYNILKYGAMPDGITDNAKAIQAAIDAAACAGGGRVVIPAGRFLSGTIRLKSNIELHLQAGAVLISSLRKEDILDFARLFLDDNLDTGWDGGCFLFACNEKNITISGTGTIYGQGDKVFFDDDTDGGYHESPLNVTSFRPRTTFFENIENLTVRDITIQDAAFWTLHMAGCRHVRISDIRILNDVRGANNDGIDPDCCSDVIITGCIRNITGDHIQMKTENALFIAGELDAVISDVTITDIKLKMCQQGTQVADSFDEQPSLRDVYPHQVPAVYLRNASRIQITGRVELEKPYCVAKNLLVIEEACEDNRVEVVCREIE